MTPDIDAIISSLYKDFRDRSQEVKRYTQFIQVIADKKAIGLSHLSEGELAPVDGFTLDRDLVKTIRASGYLLLYNLVESTLSNAIDSIHQAIDVHGVEFNQLNKNMKEVTLSHFKKAISGKKSDFSSPHPIQVAMLKMGYAKESLFSGNIDCKEIREIAKKYGFLVPDPKLNGRNVGDYVLEVKSKRNDLAHGSISFERCGRETAPEHLILVADQTILYLRAVLRSVSYFIRYKQFSEIE
ncbi:MULTISPECIES: MAE_28990/MAE_18760 family HEPN-like nuclease [unclassified Halomonas]|uniref:MAE_28990/MAE_18760 family HEPN-like nuclease n=1 Tax=unclassified Halomonas TaxID=2609666 RepID=UPI0007D8EDBE|nr:MULTISPECIES: MAE_28990/MAE_18760 family HEPN-like nuclease [unclassified Halomonas]MBT2784792.1 hypothetical protein [Halomonas sp. ISL-106]MBT2796486.1 hypothetical protein [Halomonas sp. ISL-104]OAL59734.1 hypothetical protein A6R74_00190 [Halomonas sp. ALS9]